MQQSLELVEILKEFRIRAGFLNSFKRLGALEESFALVAAACIEKTPDCITKYRADGPIVADSTEAFVSKSCGEGFTREQMLAVFLSAFPDVSDDPVQTGVYFPGRQQCRASAFLRAEKPGQGVSSTKYDDARKSFSPGAFTTCCACSHPKVLGFFVLDRREGPPALLDAIITRVPLFLN